MPGPARDPWKTLARHTPARIALGRVGVSLPTAPALAFGLAHARARDAVHAPFDAEAVCAGLRAIGHEPLVVASRATDRAVYLRRPDLGRCLSDDSRTLLAARAGMAQDEAYDLAIVIADGLSAKAAHAHAGAVVAGLAKPIADRSWTLAPVVVARGARVALGDEVGALLRARIVAVLIGERPGLSTPASLGIYLTWDPRPGRTDAERNCLSNIHAGGLSPDHAAAKLAWLIAAALQRSLTGIALKDDSDRDDSDRITRETGGLKLPPSGTPPKA